VSDEPIAAEPNEPSRGISRRTLIKRGAIIGGIAWVTPLIATTPAFAQTGSDVHACCACQGCPDGQSICNTDHTAGVGLGSQDLCTSWCVQTNGCASGAWVEGLNLWNCPGVASNGTPLCQPK